MVIMYIMIGVGIGVMGIGFLLNMLCILISLNWDKLKDEDKKELKNGTGLNSVFGVGTALLFGGSIVSVVGFSLLIFNLLNR